MSDKCKFETRKITCYNNHLGENGVTEAKVITILEKCYKNTAFSTFPYFCENSSSYEAITDTNSGNCIALSIYVKKELKKIFNIESCLIPATIPKKYHRPGYRPISHVALLIPIDNSPSDTGVFIVDPAFYFLNPMEIRDFKEGVVFSKNIYTQETNRDLTNYVSIETLKFKLNLYTEDQHFDECQMIPAGTYYTNCYAVGDPKDSWNYFLTEIVNPDEAITYGFFLQQQEGPFITTTQIGGDGIPHIDGYLKIKGDSVTYSKNLKNPQTYNINNINESVLKQINNDIGHFFNGDILKYL